MKTGTLILVRHHESEWNKLGIWTGLTDIGLTEYGFEQSEEMGKLIANIHIDQAFVSEQKRSSQTLEHMILGMKQNAFPIDRSGAINERDYGDYTGKNKWEVQKEIGEEAFENIRRGWNEPVPHGETLKMVYERAVPFYLSTIVPMLMTGKNVLVVSHGNTIRALSKYIENISDEGIKKVEMLIGCILLYQVDKEGRVIPDKKELRCLEIEGTSKKY